LLSLLLINKSFPEYTCTVKYIFVDIPKLGVQQIHASGVDFD